MNPADSSGEKILELYRRANDLCKRGEYQKALDCYGDCLVLLERAADMIGQLTVLHEIASVYELQHEYDKALDLLENCLDLATQLDERHQRAVALHRIGHIRYIKGDDHGALDFFNESMVQSAEVKDYRGWALSRAMMGQIHYTRGQVNEGVGLMIEALNVLFQINAQEKNNLIDHVRSLGKRMEKDSFECLVVAKTDNKKILNMLLRE